MIVERIGEPAMLEQLAEECTELAKAALKKARILRGENPTDATLEKENKAINEEFADVYHCAIELGITPDFSVISRKRKRFFHRWREANKE